MPLLLVRRLTLDDTITTLFRLSPLALSQVRFYKLMIEYDTHEKATFDLCQVGRVTRLAPYRAIPSHTVPSSTAVPF